MNIDFMNDKDNLTIKVFEGTGNNYCWRVYNGTELIDGSYNYRRDCNGEVEAIREARKRVGLPNPRAKSGIQYPVLDLETNIQYDSIKEALESQSYYKTATGFARAIYKKTNNRYKILK